MARNPETVLDCLVISRGAFGRMFYRANERQGKRISLGELGAAGRSTVCSTVGRIPSGLPVIRE